MTDKQIEDYGITVTGNTGWIDYIEEGYSYTLSLSSDYCEADSVTGTVNINQAPITMTLPTLTGPHYEDRLDNVKTFITDNATTKNSSGTSIAGSFTYSTPTYTGSAATSNVTMTVTFTPADTNYAEAVDTVELTLSAVAYTGSTTKTYYGTVDKAIQETSSGTINVIPGTNPIIKTDGLEIGSGVTLFLPHTDGDSIKGSANGTAEYHADGSMNDAQTQYLYTFENPSSDKGTYDGGEVATSFPNRLKSTLYIAENIILINNGTIEIAGQLSSGGGGTNYAGQTYGYYSRIVLKSSAQIESNGTINCFGYIEEESLNNGSSVVVNSGNLYMPFILRDFKGGSQTYGLYSAFGKYHSSPFNMFEFQNVTSKLRINYEGSLVAWANLYAGSQQNPTSITMIGKNEGAVIRFTDSTYSYIEAKYDKTVKTGSMSGRINLDIYGGVTANALNLSLKVLGTVDISTNDIYFPITYFYNINLKKAQGQTKTAEFVLNQRYKIMPGATLRVNEGTKLTANDLVVYSYFDDSASIMAGNKYPAKNESGNFIVNGDFVCTNFAGVIKTESNSGATVTVTGETIITSFEPKTYSGSSVSTTIEEWIPVKEQFKLYLFEGSGISNNAKTVATGTFYSKNGGWYSTEATIFYEPNGGTLSGNESEGPYQTGSSGYTITGINTMSPTRNHYDFDGWYIDSDCTQSAIGQIIYVNTYVYAKWIPIDYDVQYKNTYDQGSTDSTSQPFRTFNIETNAVLANPTNGNYVFGGWYTEETCENRITNLVGSDLISLLDGNNKLNLFALWYPQGTESYTVNYIPNLSLENEYDYLDMDYYDTYSFIITNDDWSKVSIQLLTSYDNNPKKPYYFDGWYTSPTFESNTKITALNEDVFVNSNNITLYAKWIKKCIVDVTLDTIALKYYLQPEEIITLPTIKDLGITFLDVEDKNTHIILREIIFSDGVNEYSPGDLFSTTKDVLLDGKIKESHYYMTTLNLEAGTIDISAKNGHIIVNAQDTELRNTYAYSNSGDIATTTIYVCVGTTLNIEFTYDKSEYNGYEISYVNGNSNNIVQKDTYAVEKSYWGIKYTDYAGTPKNPNSFTIGAFVYSITMSSGDRSNSDFCIFGDSEILMADGTTKLAKDIKLGDVVLTWSFAEGKYVATPIIFVEALQSRMMMKTTLFFDDGTSVALASGQSYFDVNKREFVSINSNNVMDYIGITIMGYDNDEIAYKRIVNAEVELVIENVYEFITAYEYSFIYDNVLTMEPFMLYKLPFEITEEFKYDEESVMKDIEKYGLYTYEEWSHLVTEEQFEFFNGKYIKVAVGKGYYTEDYIIEIISKYIVPENMS